MTTAAKKRVEELEAKLKQAKALVQKQEAQQRALESAQARKKETRQKILIGAMVLNLIKQEDEDGEKWKQSIMKRLDNYLVKPSDRAMFDLPPISVTKTSL